MDNEYADKVYRKLLSMLEQDKAIHFTMLDTGIYFNGFILDLSEKKYTMVLKEIRLNKKYDEEGKELPARSIPFLLEQIDLDSIAEFTTKEEERRDDR